MSDDKEVVRVVHSPHMNALGGINPETMLCGEDFDRMIMRDETWTTSLRRITCEQCRAKWRAPPVLR
jgi:hypothetical protein